MAICSLPMLSESYVLDPRPRFSFLVVAKRYWIEECPDTNHHIAPPKIGEGVLTLIFIHGSGTHKEHWEPTIKRLFEYQRTSKGASVRFHDMWAIDLLDHGDAAVLNEEMLPSRWGCDIFSWEDHARGVHAFLAGLGTGVDVDFSKRRLVLIGHSMGAIVAMLASTYYPSLTTSSLHLIEPALLGRQAHIVLSSHTRKAEIRRDIWPSPEEALQLLKVRPKWKIWDERILKIFIEHGLRPLPTAEYPDQEEGVTLKATKKQEVANSRDLKSCVVAYELMPHLLHVIPTHITYGTIIDFTPYEWQQEVLHVTSGGISNFASVTRVPGAGHMILQTHPDAVADVIWKSLAQSHGRSLKNSIAARL